MGSCCVKLSDKSIGLLVCVFNPKCETTSSSFSSSSLTSTSQKRTDFSCFEFLVNMANMAVLVNSREQYLVASGREVHVRVLSFHRTIFQIGLLMLLGMRAAIIIASSCLLFCISGLFVDSISAQHSNDIWQLNKTYTLNQSNFDIEFGSLYSDNYPGSNVSIIMRKVLLPDVFVFLCFLSSPTESSSSSSTFTLSIYMLREDINIFSPDSGAVVWTANRDTPILGTRMSLTLRSDGNLVLLGDNPDVPVWSTNTSNRGVATMELSINPVSLILYTRNRTIVWQTADHPTDTLTMNQTLLPGKRLDSWANSSSNPSSGLYSLVLEAGGLALYASMPDPQPYWVWGLYGFNDTFSVKHTCKPHPVSAFMNPYALEVSDDFNIGETDSTSHWKPFCSRTPNSSLRLHFTGFSFYDNSNFTFLRLESDGNLRVYALGTDWSKVFDLFGPDTCRLPNKCGPYGVCIEGVQCSCPLANESIFTFVDSSKPDLGCHPLKNLTCSSGNSKQTDQQVMRQLNGVYYFANDYTPPLDISWQEACVGNCSQNCSCVAAFWRVDNHRCHHIFHRLGSLRGGLDQSNYITFLKVNVSRQHDGETAHKSRAVIVVGSVVSCAVGLLVLVIAVTYIWHKKHNEMNDEEEDAILDAIPGLPNRFSYEQLLRVTNGFEQQLGKGGFGSVYAGMLPNGTKVAVKRLESMRQGNKEFRSEVAIMGGIHHNNLLRLIGFCAQKGHRLLVYEYMENGSLDAWLFGDTHKKSQLTWESRCKIGIGTAQGLSYLHKDCREKIIHLDIKPQNILLDEGFEPKVADFGLSRLVDRKEDRVMTTMRGTPGYLAPDWLREGLIDEKCDVYSFGMLLMEIISGRKNLDHSVESMEEIYYPEWAFWQAQKEDQDLRKLSDAIIETEEDLLQLRRMINTAFICVLEDPAARPSMCTVVRMLQGDVPIERVDISSLHQGLLFALKNPAFTKVHIEQIVQELVGSVSRTRSVSSSFYVDSSTMSSAR